MVWWILNRDVWDGMGWGYPFILRAGRWEGRKAVHFEGVHIFCCSLRLQLSWWGYLHGFPHLPSLVFDGMEMRT